MSDLFSAKEQISVCFLSKFGDRSEELLRKIFSRQKKEALHFDPNYCGTFIELDETMQCATGTGYTYQVAIANRPMSSGVHKWEFVIESTPPSSSSHCQIMVGCCEQQQSLDVYPGYDSNATGFSYHGSAITYHNNSNHTYGETFSKGDVIGVTLNFDEDCISFSKNGIDLGIAATGGITGKTFYPACCLLNSQDRVRLREADEDANKNQLHSLISDDVKSTRKYLRAQQLYTCSADTTLGAIHKKIAAQLTSVERIRLEVLHPRTPKEDATLREMLDPEIHNELLDIVYELSYATDISHLDNLEENSAASVTKPNLLFLTFAEKGLSDLIKKLYEHLRANSAEKKWLKWLGELNVFLRVQGFAEKFVHNSNCRAVLFHLLKDFKSANSNGLSNDALEGSTQSLHRTLFELFKDSENLPKESIVQSKCLDIVLVELADLSATPHRKPESFSYLNEFQESKEKDKKSTVVQGHTSKYWAKGTGYGTSYDDEEGPSSTWNHANYLKEQDYKARRIHELLVGLYDFLNGCKTLPEGIYETLEASCLIPVLESYLKNDSLLDMGRHIFLYRTVLQIVRSFSSHEALLPLMDVLSNQSASITDMMNTLHSMASTILKQLKKVEKTNKENEKNKEKHKTENESEEESQTSVEDQMILANEIIETYQQVKEKMDTYKKKQEAHSKEKEIPQEISKFSSLESEYCAALKQEQFGETAMLDKKREHSHHYKDRCSSETAGSAKLNRLIQEVGTLRTYQLVKKYREYKSMVFLQIDRFHSNNLPFHWGSSVFLRVDEERIDVMQALITGPDGTPYENGCFQFDIYCPKDYPKVPPLVNLQTTGGGTVRFNPNLYKCGKVCLSLLGTWEGGTNEKWNEKTSTLLQVLVSIQSLIFVKEPYFNEPGYEADMNTPHGRQQSAEYNEVIRLATIRWAMTEQLRKPSYGFENAIHTHFKLKIPSIVKLMSEWLTEAKHSKTNGYHQKLKKNVQELKEELLKLSPESADILNEMKEKIDDEEKAKAQQT